MTKTQLKLLNMGCGNVYLKHWINCDANGDGKEVSKVIAGDSLPFEKDSIDYAYCSHLLEHLTRSDGENFVRELYRIIKPGGYTRIVVPDLEAICIDYLRTLSEVRNNMNPVSVANYDWMNLELLDQMVRKKTGGEMLEMLLRDNLPNQSFIEQRVGSEALNIWRNRNKIKASLSNHSTSETSFRKSYEIHQWMYDEFSLKRLLKNAGFIGIKRYRAGIGSIPGIGLELLELEGSLPRKPDSLYLDGQKP